MLGESARVLRKEWSELDMLDVMKSTQNMNQKSKYLGNVIQKRDSDR